MPRDQQKARIPISPERFQSNSSEISTGGLVRFSSEDSRLSKTLLVGDQHVAASSGLEPLDSDSEAEASEASENVSQFRDGERSAAPTEATFKFPTPEASHLVDNDMAMHLERSETQSKQMDKYLRKLGFMPPSQDHDPQTPSGSSHDLHIDLTTTTSSGSSKAERELLKAMFPPNLGKFALKPEHVRMAKIVEVLFSMPSLEGETARDSVKFAKFLSSTVYLSQTALRFAQIRLACRKLMANTGTTCFFFLLTVYVLFAPNIIPLVFSGEGEETFFMVNTVVFFLFCLEFLLLGFGRKRYLLSLPCLLDLICLASMLSDTYLLAGVLDNQERDISRLTRSSRMTRLFRMVRMVRITRLIPRMISLLKKRNLKLARQVMSRRLLRAFKFLDTNHDDRVSLWDFKCLYLSVLRQCPHLLHRSRVALLTMDITRLQDSASLAPSDELHVLDFTEFENLFMQTGLGEDLLHSHMEELEQEEGVWSMTRKISDNSALKVCVGVLTLLAAVALLDVDVRDMGAEQHLVHLNSLAQHEHARGAVNSTIICHHVDMLLQSNSHTVLFLSLNGQTYVDADIGPSCLQQGQVQAVDPEARIASLAEKADAWDAELRVACWPNPDDCPRRMDGSGSMLLADASAVERETTTNALITTFVVVFLLLAFVLLVNRKMTHFTRVMIAPLRWLVDDMKAIACIDLLEVEKDSFEHEESHVMELHDLQLAFKGMRSAICSWSMYVPPGVVQRLYAAGVEARIGVGKSHVTVFFCDLEGFGEACKDVTPTSAIEFLATVLDKIADVILARGGTLLEFIGDEVLAVFNAPNPNKKHAESAVRAAADIHEALETHRKSQVKSAAFHSLENSTWARCGVNTAQVLAGNLGSSTRMKYGVLGDGVNLAARLKGLTTRYGTPTLVCESVLREKGLEQKFLWRTVDVVAVKGKKDPTKIYEALPVGAGFERGVKLHETAFRLYQQRKFEEAAAKFQEARDALDTDGVRPADATSQLLQSRCMAYMAQPPPPDWDGVDRLKAKVFEKAQASSPATNAAQSPNGADELHIAL